MTSDAPADARAARAWARILEWLAEYTPPSYAALRPGASDDELARLETVLGVEVPEELKAVWRLSAGEDGVNGSGLMLGDWALMPLDAVAEVHRRQTEIQEEVGGGEEITPFWEPAWIPFCSRNPHDTVSGLYLDGRTGEVRRWTRYGERDREYASLPAFLELMAISLEAPLTAAGPEKPGMLHGALVWGPPEDERGDAWVRHLGQAAPRHPAKTPGAIRAALPHDERDAFDQRRDALDLADPEAVAAFLDQWWGRAVHAQEELEDDIAAALRGNIMAQPGRRLAPEHEAALPPAIRHRPPSFQDIRTALRHESVRARFDQDHLNAIPPHFPALLLRWWDIARLMADPRGDRAVRAVVAGRHDARKRRQPRPS
ncbi:SMI1/KNR4 family protein [Streptomyces sp. NBC_00523]|uniref:SMI1/KNR4 family protein n=1 Tax=Streptomyces sp. NBC_00523 TaxID=2975765 RepID=UPI002E8111B7|nr:SMI1/KNR4 family protein [Streptomyces sp. NBC_00523]WUC98460.1 SMI1/KNR4 family protein [Streptomyces sp. NBC_00523]